MNRKLACSSQELLLLRQFAKLEERRANCRVSFRDTPRKMNETLRPRKSLRNIAVAGLVVSTGMFVWLVCEALIHGLPLLAAGFASVVLIWFATICVFFLAAYKREIVLVHDGTMTKRTVFSERRIELGDVKTARWKTTPAGGSIILETATTNLSVEFFNYDGRRDVELIQHLRTTVPVSVQHDWEIFCSRIALPLLRRHIFGRSADEVLLTRRRWDWFFLPLAFATLITGSLLWTYWRREPGLLLMPIPFLAFWVYLRIATPKEGLPCKRVPPESIRATGLMLLWLLIGVLSFLAIASAGWLEPGGRATAPVVWGLVWFGGLVTIILVLERHRKTREEQAASTAAEEWARIVNGIQISGSSGDPVA